MHCLLLSRSISLSLDSLGDDFCAAAPGRFNARQASVTAHLTFETLRRPPQAAKLPLTSISQKSFQEVHIERQKRH